MAAGQRALAQGIRGEAENEFQLALAAAEDLGPLKVAESLTYLGLTFESLHKYNGAEPLYARALALREQEPNGAELDIAASLEHHARLLEILSRYGEASSERERAKQIRAKRIEEKFRERSDELLSVTGNVTPPRLTHRIDPAYAEEARLARLQGAVELYFEVWPDGRAHNFRLRQGLGLGLDENAVEAVRQWRFQPSTKDGAPVSVGALATVNYRLR